MVTVEPTFERVFGHTSGNLFRQISGIILSHTFQNCFQDNAFRALGNGFYC